MQQFRVGVDGNAAVGVLRGVQQDEVFVRHGRRFGTRGLRIATSGQHDEQTVACCVETERAEPRRGRIDCGSNDPEQIFAIAHRNRNREFEPAVVFRREHA